MGVGDIDNDVLFSFYLPFALLFEQKVVVLSQIVL